MNAGQIGAGAAQFAYPCAGGEEQLVVGKLAAIGQFDGSLGAMDRFCTGAKQKLAAGFRIISVGLEEQARPLKRPQQIGLGQRRALIGRISLITHHGDGAAKAFGAQALHGLGACLAGADDHDCFRHFPR